MQQLWAFRVFFWLLCCSCIHVMCNVAVKHISWFVACQHPQRQLSSTATSILISSFFPACRHNRLSPVVPECPPLSKHTTGRCQWWCRYLAVHSHRAQVALPRPRALQHLPGPNVHRGELSLVVLADLPFARGRAHPVGPDRDWPVTLNSVDLFQ